MNEIKFLKDIYLDLSMKIFSGSLDEKPTVNRVIIREKAWEGEGHLLFF